MTLAAGSQLGSHRIIGLLGAGGMGEVYRAHDTKLNRQVAIKILPAEYARDPERVARFQREAQAVAALNHPGVAAIYEFARADDIGFLVLELVEGETLADRLRRGAVPPEEALAITKEICDALEAAHEKGICHRDLKPANIKITPDGKVKVLDFGLAKVLQDSSVQANVTNSPTLSLGGTFPGVVLGTAGYMSPEQAKGFAADHRSDIFSLGCVLYELLTGRLAFEGDSASEILASVLKLEPDYTRLPARLNPRVVELLRRCLEKQPKRRWHAVADVRVEVESILAHGVFAREARETARPWWRRALPVAAGILLGALSALVGVRVFSPATPSTVARFTIAIPEAQRLAVNNRALIAFSPRGTELVYVADDRIYLRTLGELQPRPIIGTEGSSPTNVVFSPDGRSIAYFSTPDRAIKRIAISGGAPVTICVVEPPAPFSVSWSPQGLLFVKDGQGILRVSPNGGTPKLIIPAEPGESLAGAQQLPDGRTVLFSVAQGTAPGRWDLGQIAIQTIGGARKVLIEGGADPRYVPSGHLVYALGGMLLAVPFDVERLEVQGGAVPVVEGVRRAVYTTNVAGTAQYSFSENGSLVYLPGPTNISNSQSDLAFVDRDGKATPLKLPSASYQGPRISPNGKSLAVATDEGKEAIVWVYDLNSRGSIQRLTFGGKNRYPVWSADSEWVAFQSDAQGDAAVFRQRANGRGQPERLTKPEPGTQHIPYSWSPDGKILLVGVVKSSRYAIGALKFPERTFTPWGGLEATIPLQPAISPDGRWIAYQSNETGSNQIFVQPFPEAGAKYMVPAGQDNHHPAWMSDGKALTYIPSQGVSYLVDVTTSPQFAFGTPRSIERGGRVEGPAQAHRNHDARPGSQQIVGVLPAGAAQTGTATAQIQIVLNWFEDLKQRVPR